MKKSIFTLAALIFTLAAAAQTPSTYTLHATTLNQEGEPIAYSYVTLTTDGSDYNPADPSHRATTTSTEGEFTLEAPEGQYTLSIYNIGYKDYHTAISLSDNLDLGTITLEADAEVIDDVVIVGNLITREADRYVMNNISESALAAGRDSYEMLQLAPGVWADPNNGDISINGKQGIKILINEREVRMSGEQLMAYLKAIPAENLQRIEIIPTSGADYDANSSAGVIRITVKKQRDSGLSGSAALFGHFATISPSYSYGPNGNINYKSGRWNLYSSLNLTKSLNNSGNLLMEEHTRYTSGAEIISTTAMDTPSTNGGGMAGVIYDLDDRSSVGVEYNLWLTPEKFSTTTGSLRYILGDVTEYHDGIYEKTNGAVNQSFTANYIRRLDDKGSVLKIIGDWASNNTHGYNLNTDTSYSGVGNTFSPKVDSLYRNSSLAKYTYYTLTAAVEKKLSDYTSLSYGAKYTLTDSYSATDYDYKRGDEWVSLGDYNHLTDYNEHIGALYAIYSARTLSGLSLSAGLRAEYTSIPQLSENYLSLFPHLNFALPLTPTQSVILSGNYRRAITRPSFWTMNPVRQQLSEYSYQVGNPDLRPVYGNDISLTGVFAYRYSFTLGAYLQDKAINQIATVDEADPTGRTLKYIHVNLNNLYQYYAQIAIPAQVTPWWSINANLLGVMIDQRIVAEQKNDRTFTLQGSLNSNTTIPQGWVFNLTARFMTNAKVGNLTQLGSGNLSVGITKRLLDNKLSLSLSFNNLLNTSSQRVDAVGEGFTKSYYAPNLWMRSINVGIRYNFQAGKMFKARSVESGASEEKGRM